MTWRSIVISKRAHLKTQLNQLVISQGDNEAKVPIEDLAVIVIDSLQVSLTSKLLSLCVDHKIAVLFIDELHLPNGILLPYMNHSRQLKTVELQQSISKPRKKRAWQALIKSKLINQSQTLHRINQVKPAQLIEHLSDNVRSGDPDNLEAQAAQFYFPALFDERFVRSQERFYNAAINYSYAVVRSAIARSLTIYGFLPIWGIKHHSQLNSFNLADDLLEPFRAFVDAWVVDNWPHELDEQLSSEHKAVLVNILYQEVQIDDERMSIINATKQLVKSLIHYYRHGDVKCLALPTFSYESSQ